MTAVPVQPSRPVLVALDNGEDRHVALEFAAAEAESSGRELHVLHVVHPLTRAMSPREPVGDSPRDAARTLLEEAVRTARASAGETVAVHTEVREGSPIDLILQAAADSDRVFLQRRHLSALDNVLNGPVVAAVAARSPVPVVVVPEAFSGWDLPGRRRVTVAVKRHGCDDGLLEEAFWTAARMQAGLRVLRALAPHRLHGEVHGVGLRSAHHVDPGLPHGHGADAIAAAELRLLEDLNPIRSRYPEVPVTVQVVRERPVLALLEATADSDLLLISRPPTRLRASALGTLSRALLRESVCPVEVVPTHLHVPAHAGGPGRHGADSWGPIY
ncbi:MAG TPA: universal stress protein [Marmoricola sp.]|nr:universal stress protein [Marmoricola sp.]